MNIQIGGLKGKTKFPGADKTMDGTMAGLKPENIR